MCFISTKLHGNILKQSKWLYNNVWKQYSSSYEEGNSNLCLQPLLLMRNIKDNIKPSLPRPTVAWRLKCFVVSLFLFFTFPVNWLTQCGDGCHGGLQLSRGTEKCSLSGLCSTIHYLDIYQWFAADVNDTLFLLC